MPGEKLLEKSRKFVALEDISFELRKGETIGIVGESGCGKTTLGQLICGIQTKSAGNIQYAGKAQIIFQDPYSSLNPKMKVEDLIAEPYDAKNRYKKKTPLHSHMAENFMRMMCFLPHCFCISTRSLRFSAETVCRRSLTGLLLTLEEGSMIITRKTAASGRTECRTRRSAFCGRRLVQKF